MDFSALRKSLTSIPAQNGKGIGRIRYRDLNNDGVVNEDDRTWIGDPYPDFIYGLNVNLEYKGLILLSSCKGYRT